MRRIWVSASSAAASRANRIIGSRMARSSAMGARACSSDCHSTIGQLPLRKRGSRNTSRKLARCLAPASSQTSCPAGPASRRARSRSVADIGMALVQ